MNFASGLRIMCARCTKPVLRYEWSFDLDHDAYRIRVDCHGDFEVTYLSRKDVMQCVLVDAWAFKPQLEPPPPPKLENHHEDPDRLPRQVLDGTDRP